jgi:hypothetical protein
MSSATVEYGIERRELAHRSGDGLEVSLLWSEETGSLCVAVRDDRSGAGFELVVESGAEALDVFDHPFAYAAWRGIEYDLAEAPDA